MTQKHYDIVAVTGEYQDDNGETKKRYLNVGAILENDNGKFIVLEKWYNHAASENKFLSLFKPKEDGA